MLTPEQLRKELKFFRQSAIEESHLTLKRPLVSHALVLTQIAEKIGRRETDEDTR